MLNIKKKGILLSGQVSMPLIIGQCAVIYHIHGEKTITPAVAAVKRISEKFIVFETRDSIYCVVPQFVPETMAMDEKILACA